MAFDRNPMVREETFYYISLHEHSLPFHKFLCLSPQTLWNGLRSIQKSFQIFHFCRSS